MAGYSVPAAGRAPAARPPASPGAWVGAPCSKPSMGAYCGNQLASGRVAEEGWAMDATLAPNGATRYLGQERCGRLHVATLDGVVTLERAGTTWQVAGRALAGCHIS